MMMATGSLDLFLATASIDESGQLHKGIWKYSPGKKVLRKPRKVVLSAFGIADDEKMTRMLHLLLL